MTKGKRSTHYNLRRKLQALTRSSKKKSKQVNHSSDCSCPPGYFDLKTGVCRCTCHRQDNTETVHEPSGSPRRNNPVPPSILQQEYLLHLNQETAAQAGQSSPSTSFQAAAQAGQSSPFTSFQAAAQAGQSSPSTSFQIAAQAGAPSPTTSFTAISPPEEIFSRISTRPS